MTASDRVQRVLEYFGLAYAAGEEPAPASRRDWFLITATPLLLAFAVQGDRGTPAALVVVALCLPAVVLASRIGRLATVDDRFGNGNDPLFMLGLMLAGMLLLIPDRFGWTAPVSAAVVLTTLLQVGGARGHRGAASR